jgi:flagellar hook-length control protein FliK
MDIASLYSSPSAATGTVAGNNLQAGEAGAAGETADGAESFNRLLASFLDQSARGGSKTQSSIDKANSLFGDAVKQSLSDTTTTSEDDTALATGFNQLPRQVRAAVPDMRWQQAGLNLLAMNQADTPSPPLSDEVTSFLNDLSALMRQQGVLSGKVAGANGEEDGITENAEGGTAATAEDGQPEANLVAMPMMVSAAEQTATKAVPTLTPGTRVGTNAATANAGLGFTEQADITANTETNVPGLSAGAGASRLATAVSAGKPGETTQPSVPAAESETVAGTASSLAAINPNGPTGAIPLPKGIANGDGASIAAMTNQPPQTTTASVAAVSSSGPTAAPAAAAASQMEAATDVQTVTDSAGVATGLGETASANPTPASDNAGVKGQTERPVAKHSADHVSKGQDRHNTLSTGMASKTNAPVSTTNTPTAADDDADVNAADEQGTANSAEPLLAAIADEQDSDPAKAAAAAAAAEQVAPLQPMAPPETAESAPMATVATLDREAAISGNVAETRTATVPAGAPGTDKLAAGNRPQATPSAAAGNAAAGEPLATTDTEASADTGTKEGAKEGGKSPRMLAPEHTDPENSARAGADQAGDRPQPTTRTSNGNIGSPANNAGQDSLLNRAVGASDGTASGDLGSDSQSAETGTLASQESSLNLAADASHTNTTDFTQHLRQASAPTGSQRPGATPTATYQVALQVQRATQDGNDKISIQLRPYDLGRVDVQLEFNNEGKLRAKVTADSIQTLDLLQKDSRNLERALQEAGLSTDQNSLSFSLRDDSDQAQRQQQDNQQEKKSGTRLANIEVEEEMPAVPAYRPVIGPGRVDVRI